MAFRNFKADEWLDEIDLGLEYRRRYGLEDKWGMMEAIYYNVHGSMANDGPNIIMSTGDSMLSSVTVPSPTFMVKAMTKDSVTKAPIVEAIDNLLLREMCLKYEVERASLHAYLFGKGILKAGFDSEFGYDPSLDVGGNLKLGFTLSQVNEKGSRRIEHDSGIAPGMPWVRAVPPHDIVVPWGTLDIESAPWVAHRFVRHIDDLKADRKYSNTKQISPTVSMEDFNNSYLKPIKSTKGRNSRKSEYVEMWEIHDRRTGKIYVVNSGDDPRFLRDDVNALQIDNVLPFASVSFTPTTRMFWTTPDAYYLLAGQLEISDLAVQRTKQRRISALKFGVQEDAIDDEELKKATSPDVGMCFKIKSGMKLSDAIAPLQSQGNQYLVEEEMHIRSNLREQIGFSRNQLGEFSGGRKTATESKIVSDASALRMSRRGLAIKRLYEDTIAIVNGIIFTHWTLPRWVEVAGPQTGPEWQSIIGSSLKSRYAYEVTFTEEAETRQRRIEAVQLYSLLLQDPSIDPIALRSYMVDAYNDPSFGRLFNADIQRAMQLMRLSGGTVPAAGGTNSSGAGNAVMQMPQLPASPQQNNVGGYAGPNAG